MPLTNAGLSDAIKAKMVAKKGAPQDAAALQDFCDALAEAIVTYIKASAVVTSTGAVATGAGAGGTVTATGSIT